MDVTISRRAVLNTVTITGLNEEAAVSWILDAYRKAVRRTDTSYLSDCVSLTVRNGVVERVKQHRFKVGNIYVSRHAVNRACQRFDIKREEAAEWIAGLLNRAKFVAITKDGKGEFGRNFIADGVVIGTDINRTVVKTVYPAIDTDYKLYRKFSRVARKELRLVRWKLRAAQVLRLPTTHLEQLVRGYEHTIRSIVGQYATTVSSENAVTAPTVTHTLGVHSAEYVM